MLKIQARPSASQNRVLSHEENHPPQQMPGWLQIELKQSMGAKAVMKWILG